MRFPSIKDVATELTGINANVECEDDEECDVRLQVYPDGQWIVRSGDSSYDQDHTGYWGASSVPGVVNGETQRFNANAVARNLIEQVKEHFATSE